MLYFQHTVAVALAELRRMDSSNPDERACVRGMLSLIGQAVRSLEPEAEVAQEMILILEPLLQVRRRRGFAEECLGQGRNCPIAHLLRFE